MGGRAPTVGVESKLQPRGESYKKQLLGMWMEFSLNVFHEKISNFIFFYFLLLSVGALPPLPIDTGLRSHKIEKL